MRYINAKQCTGLTKTGHPCKNHIIEGERCWLHTNRGVMDGIDPRHIVIVKCFKCPHCGELSVI